jgi:hypothetical protein
MTSPNAVEFQGNQFSGGESVRELLTCGGHNLGDRQTAERDQEWRALMKIAQNELESTGWNLARKSLLRGAEKRDRGGAGELRKAREISKKNATVDESIRPY